MQRAADIVEGRVSGINDKLLKRNQMIMYAVIMLMIVCNLYSIKNANTFSFKKEEFRKKYDTFVEKNKDDFLFDKTIDSVVKNNLEYSFLQKSSIETGSLIAVFEQSYLNHKIKRVGVIGKYKNQDGFLEAYRENMATLLGTLIGKNFYESIEILKNMKILDENYSIIYRDKNLIVKYEDVEINFLSQEDKLIFSIENK